MTYTWFFENSFEVLSPRPDGCTPDNVAGCDTPYREMLFNIPPEFSAIFYTLAFVAALFLLFSFVRVVRIWLVGRRTVPIKQMVLNLRYALRDGGFNARIFRRDLYAGVMHMAIMSGMIVEFIGTILATMHEREEWVGVVGLKPFLFGDVYLVYSFILDLFGIVLIVGVMMAAYRRYVKRHPRMVQNDFYDAFILVGLFIVGATGIVTEGLRIIATDFPSWEVWSFAGWLFALALAPLSLDLGALEAIHFTTWWVHAITAQVGIGYVMVSKLGHIPVAPINMLFKEDKPFGRVTVDAERPIRTVQDMTMGQLVSLEACMTCGRCHDVCPAQASGEPLSPMMVIQDSKGHARLDYPLLTFFRSPKNPSVVAGGEKVTADVLWACTNCMACVDACPVWIPHVDIITGMRSALVEEGKQVPSTVTSFLESVYQNGNEWGGPKKDRVKWAKGLDVPEARKVKAELLWYVGCTSTYDPRNQKVARTFVRIMEAAGVNYGTLGRREGCTGDVVRRVGEEALYQELASKNIEAFQKSGAKRIVTTSPHAFNTIKNEYPEFGFDSEQIEVLHHTELLWELIEQGKLKLTKPVNRTVTFHDACYMGRYNQIIDVPRKILGAIPGLTMVEMRRHGLESFCCGGGGGRMFMPQETEIRPSEIRVKEAQETKASELVVECPWCLSMFDDAVKTVGADGEMAVLDICELVLESLEVEEDPTTT